MMTRAIVTAALFALGNAGCGSDCDRTNIDGTYKVETSEIGGDCGDAGTFLVQFDNGASTQDNNCVADYDRWSDGDCKNEISITCVDAANNQRATGVKVINQNSDGSEIDGTMSLTIRNATTGATICTGTYDATYTRQ